MTARGTGPITRTPTLSGRPPLLSLESTPRTESTPAMSKKPRARRGTPPQQLAPLKPGPAVYATSLKPDQDLAADAQRKLTAESRFAADPLLASFNALCALLHADKVPRPRGPYNELTTDHLAKTGAAIAFLGMPAPTRSVWVLRCAHQIREAVVDAVGASLPLTSNGLSVRSKAACVARRDAMARAIERFRLPAQELAELRALLEQEDWRLGGPETRASVDGKYSADTTSPAEAMLDAIEALLPAPTPQAATSRPIEAPAADTAERASPGALTPVDRAMILFTRDPNQSVRTIAKQAGCHHSVLSRSQQFRDLRNAHARHLRHGSKSADGRLEAEDPSDD